MPYTPIAYHCTSIPGEYTNKPSRVNEDAWFPNEQRKIEREKKGFLAAVLDGMSSGGQGSEASRKASFTLKTQWEQYSAEKAILNPLEVIYELMGVAQQSVVQSLNGQGGTTCLLLLIQGDLLTFGHVGDCQLYHSSVGKPITLLTQDQSALLRTSEGRTLQAQFAQYRQQNKSLPNDFQRQYAIIENQLTRYLGHPYLDSDISSVRQWVEVGQIRLQKDDVIIACTDGVIKALSPENQPLGNRQAENICKALEREIRQEFHGIDHDDATFCVLSVYEIPEAIAPAELITYTATYIADIGEEVSKKPIHIEKATPTEPPKSTSIHHKLTPEKSFKPSTSSYPTIGRNPTPPPHSQKQQPNLARKPLPTAKRLPIGYVILIGVMFLGAVLGIVYMNLKQPTKHVFINQIEGVTTVPISTSVEDVMLGTPTEIFSPTHTTPTTPTSTAYITPTAIPELNITQWQATERFSHFGTFTYPIYSGEQQLITLFGDREFDIERYKQEYSMYQFTLGASEWEQCSDPWSCRWNLPFPYLIPADPSVAFVGTIVGTYPLQQDFAQQTDTITSYVILQIRDAQVFLQGDKLQEKNLQPGMTVAVIGQYVRTDAGGTRYFGENVFAPLSKVDTNFIIAVDWIRKLSEAEQNILWEYDKQDYTDITINPVWLYCSNERLMRAIIQEDQWEMVQATFNEAPYAEHYLLHGQWISLDDQQPRLKLHAVYAQPEGADQIDYRCVKTQDVNYGVCNR